MIWPFSLLKEIKNPPKKETVEPTNKCPKCGEPEEINSFRMPTGPKWCEACGFRVEQKELDDPFYIPLPVPEPEPEPELIPEPEPIRCKVQLIISLSNQTKTIGVNCSINKEDAIKTCGEDCWRNYTYIPFLQWWYDTDKPYYALRYSTGEFMVNRKEVSYFQIHDHDDDD